MRFVFFSMNDFTRQGGGTIRMQGVLNELSSLGHEVVFVSNVEPSLAQSLFHPSITHYNIGMKFSPRDKRVFQAMLGLLPISLVNYTYRHFLARLKVLGASVFREGEPVYFCEYLDNSIGYWLKRNKVIQSYINDLHGVATLEFDFQYRQASNWQDKLKFYAKYRVSANLDRKVCNQAEGLIFASQAMKVFFLNLYPKLASKRNYILPYVLGSDACAEQVDQDLRNQLVAKYAIRPEEKIILFAGAFKKTGGVPDLIAAFAKLPKEQSVRLMLVGDGPTMGECRALVGHLRLNDRVTFVGRTPYQHLRTYQDLADIIVCPDKQNMYSELIIHVKYLDALVSGKVVINGSFKSVLEVNTNDSLSISFTPSDIDSLADSISYGLENLATLKIKYQNNVDYVCTHLTYRSMLGALADR